MVGDEEISADDLHDLARLKVPLLRVKGRWVELDDRQLTAAIRAVEQHRAGELTIAEVLGRGRRGRRRGPAAGRGRRGRLARRPALRRRRPTPAPDPDPGDVPGHAAPVPGTRPVLAGLPVPPGHRRRPRGRHGLGKDRADVVAAARRAGARRRVGADAAGLPDVAGQQLAQGGREVRALARVYVHHGATRGTSTRRSVDARPGHHHVRHRAAGPRRLRDVEWGRVVCDEAQAIKNCGTRQAQAVRAIPARTRLALTGTPVENHLAELWSIMDFANPGLLGPAKTFRRRYQEPIEVRQDEDAAAALKRATGPFVLRRLKTDKTIISDLPEKLEMKVWCPLTPEQAALYQAVVDDMLNKIGSSAGIERRGNVLAAMTRLKQVCNHPAHLLRDGSRLAGRSGKLARLQELAEEIVDEGDKALVFTQYAEFGSLLQPYLAAHLDRPVLWLHGGLSKTAARRAGHPVPDRRRSR